MPSRHQRAQGHAHALERVRVLAVCTWGQMWSWCAAADLAEPGRASPNGGRRLSRRRAESCDGESLMTVELMLARRTRKRELQHAGEQLSSTAALPRRVRAVIE